MFGRTHLIGFALLFLAACSGGGNSFPEPGVPGTEQPPPASTQDTTGTTPTDTTTGTTTGTTGGSTTTPTTGTGGTTGGTTSDCRDGDQNCCRDGDNNCDCDRKPNHCRTVGLSVRSLGGREVGLGAPLDAVPQIVQDMRGDLVAVWRAFDGKRHDLWANQYRAGAWGTPQLLESRAEDVGEPHLALDANGDALVVFDQANGVEHPVWAARFRNGAGWESPRVISRPGTSVPPFAFGPRVVVDGSGNAVATWRQFDDAPFARLWSNRFQPGVGWAGAAPLASQ